MKTLSKSLGIDMAGLAQLIRDQGRGRDTVLAHITPKEAALLKSRGGRGSINPKTGLPEYDDGDVGGIDTSSVDTSGGGGGQGGGGVAADQSFYSQFSQPTQTDTGIQSPFGYNQPTPVTPDVVTPTAASDGYDMSQYASQPAPTISSQATDSGGFAPGAQTVVGPQDTVTADTSGAGGGGTSWMKDLVSGLGGAAGLLKLAGTAGVGALGANYAQQAAQQGQSVASQIGQLAPAINARAAGAQTSLGNIANQAQNYGQQAVSAIGQVIPQLQTIGQNVTALGQPLSDQGTALMSQAQSGALTPANQAALDALRAQAQQNISARGGVGAMQAGQAEANLRAQLAQQEFQQGQQVYQAGAQYALQGQSLAAQAANLGLSQAQVALAQNNLANQIQTSGITLALQQAGIADQYTVNGLMVGLQSDQALATNMQNFYKSLAQVAFSTPMSQAGQTATRTTA